MRFATAHSVARTLTEPAQSAFNRRFDYAACPRRDAASPLSDLRAQLAPYYSHIGRPSIDAELMIRMLLIGYCYGIRSERRLCEEVSLNLAYRWSCRLGIEDAVPDHSTFSKTRHCGSRDADNLRKVFETTVRTCIGQKHFAP